MAEARERQNQGDGYDFHQGSSLRWPQLAAFADRARHKCVIKVEILIILLSHIGIRTLSLRDIAVRTHDPPVLDVIFPVVGSTARGACPVSPGTCSRRSRRRDDPYRRGRQVFPVY